MAGKRKCGEREFQHRTLILPSIQGQLSLLKHNIPIPSKAGLEYSSLSFPIWIGIKRIIAYRAICLCIRHLFQVGEKTIFTPSRRFPFPLIHSLPLPRSSIHKLFLLPSFLPSTISLPSLIVFPVDLHVSIKSPYQNFRSLNLNSSLYL